MRACKKRETREKLEQSRQPHGLSNASLQANTNETTIRDTRNARRGFGIPRRLGR